MEGLIHASLVDHPIFKLEVLRIGLSIYLDSRQSRYYLYIYINIQQMNSSEFIQSISIILTYRMFNNGFKPKLNERNITII